MIVTVDLPPEIALRLAEKAAGAGKTIEAYLEGLAEDEVHGRNGHEDWSSELSVADFEHLLDELAAGPTLPQLPDDFSRADIYTDVD